MSVQRLAQIPGFSIDRAAAAAGNDPDVLRLENLDTDIPPRADAIAATLAATGKDEGNSWLPFTGRDDLKDAVAAFVERRGGPRYDEGREIASCRTLLHSEQPLDDLAAANAEWQRRPEEMLRQLTGLPAVASLGFPSIDVSNRPLEQRVAATPMRGWGGEVAGRHIRFVFNRRWASRSG